MSHTRLWISAVIIASVIIVGFVLSVPHTRDIVESRVSLDTVAHVPKVTLRDNFKKGLHTITGSLDIPNACSTVSAQATYADVPTAHILVAVSLSKDTGVCLQVSTRATFQTTITASEHLPFTVTVNNASATTTVL